MQACIAYVLVITTPHPMVHVMYARSITNTLIIEYAFHLTITGAVSVLAYYQYRFLVLAILGKLTERKRRRIN